MHTQKRMRIIIFAVVALIIASVFIIASNRLSDSTAEIISERPTDAAIDFVLDTYSSWNAIRSSTTTDPYSSEEFLSSMVSEQVRSTVLTARTERPEYDALSCQTIVPDQVRARLLFEATTTAQALVSFRKDGIDQPEIALVSLEAINGKWQISEVFCSAGDVAPEVEFTYNREGLLLKSVPPPFTAGNWHLVFEQDGQMGHVTPLFFSATTTCVASDGSSQTCNPDTFVETSRATVFGSMTELGAEVERIEFR